MLSRLLPVQADNAYRGHALALLILAPILAVKLLMGLNLGGLNPWVSARQVIEQVDGVPLTSFPAAAADMVVFMYGAWGISLLVISLFGLVVLTRYRAFVPLLLCLLLLEQAGREVLSLGMAHSATAGITLAGVINWGLSALLVAGLALSLFERRTVAAPR